MDNSKRFRVNVVGAGVCGLAVAYAIKQKYGDLAEITITADKFYDETTSIAAGGLWEPYLLGETPTHLVYQWSQCTYDHYQKLYFSENSTETGVQQIKVHNLYSDDDGVEKIPFWSTIPNEFTCPVHPELQDMGYPTTYTFAHSFTSYVADPRYYLAFLNKYLLKHGVQFEKKKISNIMQQMLEKDISGARKYDIVVNCTGLGAIETEDDNTMFPIRGQVIRVHAPWIKASCTFGSSYIIPNVDSVVIGGTGQKGNWNTDESSSDSKKILDGVSQIFPGLRKAKIIKTYVGLRPCRPSLRLDSEIITSAGQPQCLVRCYGLGGSGYTVGMGLAQDVVEAHIRPFLTGLREKIRSKL